VTTLVHVADAHLETVFPDVRGGGARRAVLADAFTRAIDLAIERNADALTIAGDLYEAERAGPQTARFLFAAFARFGKPVFIAPGNHDPSALRGLYARDDVPRNVHVFADASWSAVPLADDVTLYGFAHTAADPGRPFAGVTFDWPGTRIALVHGSDETRIPPGKAVTAPFTPNEIRAAGATLALCGHYHGGYTHRDAAGPVLAYPGSLEPIKFGERDVHGALVVRVDAGKAEVEHVKLSRTRLIEVDVALDGIGDEDAALRACERALAGFGSADYVRASLLGMVESGTRIDRAVFVERCGPGLGALEVVDRTLQADYAALARQHNVRGRALTELLASEDPDAQRALALVVAAFDGAEMRP
jgi:exonuclease SbcD